MIEWQPRLDEMGVVLGVFDGIRNDTKRRKYAAGLLTFVGGWKRNLEAMESPSDFWNEFKTAGGIDALNTLDDIAQQVMCCALTGRKGAKQAEPYVLQLSNAYRSAEAKARVGANVDT